MKRCIVVLLILVAIGVGFYFGLNRGASYKKNVIPKNLTNSNKFINSIMQGDIKSMQLFVDVGMNPNIREINGETALMLAVSYDHLRMKKGTIMADIEKSFYTKDSTDAISIAMTKLLLDKGTDVNASDTTGTTALMRAATYGHAEIAKLLIEKGANVNATSIQGNTALMSAATFGRTQIAKVLLDHGAKINPVNQVGFTPLQCAVSGGHLDIVRMLLEKGADVSVKNKYGMTALATAKDKSLSKIVELLKQAGAKE